MQDCIVPYTIKANKPPHSPGTRPFLVEDALTRLEVEQAVQMGFSLWDELSGWQFDIIGLGELGVGNTLAAEALACAMLNLEPEQVVDGDRRIIKLLGKSRYYKGLLSTGILSPMTTKIC